MWHGLPICGRAGAFAPIWLKFRCTGKSWAYLLDRSSTAYSPIPFGNYNRLGDIEYLCQNMKHRFTYLWQIRSFCWHIIDVLAHHWSASQRVGSWDTARGFLAFPAGVFLAYDWRSFTTEIFNLVQNELLGYVWSQLWQAASHYGCYHSSPGTPQKRQLSHRSACTLTLNQWTQCTPIYHDTSPLGSGGSSYSAPAKIWTYAWSVWWRPPLTCLELSALCQLSVGGRGHRTTKPYMHKPGQLVTPFNSILTK